MFRAVSNGIKFCQRAKRWRSVVEGGRQGDFVFIKCGELCSVAIVSSIGGKGLS